MESSQTAADLKLHLDKYQAQLKEAQIAVAEKTSALDQEVFKYKRVQVSRHGNCTPIGVYTLPVKFTARPNIHPVRPKALSKKKKSEIVGVLVFVSG